MVVAAKSLVLTAVDLFTDPKQVAAAKASFEKSIKLLENRKYPYEFFSAIDHVLQNLVCALRVYLVRRMRASEEERNQDSDSDMHGDVR